MSIIHGVRRTLARATALGAFTFFFIPSPHAQTITPRSDPGDEKGAYVTYVGHYGEALKMQVTDEWEIRPAMHGAAEVINYYPSSHYVGRGKLPKPFNPKPEDFVPENFSRDELIQLIVLPWSASSSKSLETLKPQKIADLKASGVEFRIVDDPWLGYGSWNQRWPNGTFEVFIASPYLLSQLYTSSGDHLVIMTQGRDKPPSYEIARHADQLRMSVRDWVAVAPKSGEEDPKTYGHVPAREAPETGISLRIFLKPTVWMTWGLVNGIACLLFGVLGVAKRMDPLRRAGLSLLIFSNAGAVIGGIIGVCFWPFSWSSPHLPLPSALACLVMPLLAWAVGRARRRRPRRQAMIGLSAWAAVSSIFFVYVALVSALGSEWAPHIPSFTAMIAFVIYSIGGIIFGMLDSEVRTTGAGRALATLALFLCSARPLWAQTVAVPIEKGTPNPIEKSMPSPTEPAAVTRAKQELAKHDINRDSFKDKAKKNLSKDEVLYEYQRVEIKGILAKDLTDKTIKNLFDMEIAPSHSGDKGNSTVNPAWLQEAWNKGRDFYDLHADAYGSFTETAKKAVAALEKKEVNEIVAHSWGTEIVYNAILAGKITPPRRLIVCGMPDRDMEKWVVLSKYTGTEVVVYANSHDPAARAARIVGGALESAGESPAERLTRQTVEKKFGIDTTTKGFEEAWEAACRERSCNQHSRQPAAPAFNYTYKGPTHSRLEYYRAMLKDNTIPFDQSDAYALRDKQEARVGAETDKLYAEAVASVVANDPESTKVESDLGFRQLWERETTPLAEKARAAQAVQDAERMAREQRAREAQERQARQAEAEARAAQEAAATNTTPSEDLNAEAARCGYQIKYDADGETMIGFYNRQNSFQVSRYKVPFDFEDIKIVFLLTNVCTAIDQHPHNAPPPACNGSAALARERIGRADFLPKLQFIASWYPSTNQCIGYVLDNVRSFNDTRSFDKFIASFQKRYSKRVAEAEEWRREMDKRDKGRENDRERGSDRPSGGNDPDRVYDPGCGCWIRKY